MPHLRSLALAMFLGITASALATTTIDSREKIKPVSVDAATTSTESPQAKLKTLSEQLMNSVRDNETEKIEGLAKQVVKSATKLKQQAEREKDAALINAAEQILKSGKRIQKIGKDGTIAEHGMLLEKLHQQVLALPIKATTDAKSMGNKLCPITGQPVGSMQKGSHIVHQGQKIGLCCDSCKGAFLANPEANIVKAKQSVPR